MVCLNFRRDAHAAPAWPHSLGSSPSLLPAFMVAGKPCPLGASNALLKSSQTMFQFGTDYSRFYKLAAARIFKVLLQQAAPPANVQY